MTRITKKGKAYDGSKVYKRMTATYGEVSRCLRCELSEKCGAKLREDCHRRRLEGDISYWVFDFSYKSSPKHQIMTPVNKESKIGDEVWCAEYGNGKIIMVNENHPVSQIYVKRGLNPNYVGYTIDGTKFGNELPTLFKGHLKDGYMPVLKYSQTKEK